METEYNFEQFCSWYGYSLIWEWINNLRGLSNNFEYIFNAFKNAPCKSDKLSILKTYFIYDNTRTISDRRQFYIFNETKLDFMMSSHVDDWEKLNESTKTNIKCMVKNNFYEMLNKLQ